MQATIWLFIHFNLFALQFHLYLHYFGLYNYFRNYGQLSGMHFGFLNCFKAISLFSHRSELTIKPTEFASIISLLHVTILTLFKITLFRIICYFGFHAADNSGIGYYENLRYWHLIITDLHTGPMLTF